ncbi:MAG: hypothetical protein KH230_25200 [Enterocloster asparagiformis]|nr:hypothetical protein [Enterocloster asparagiformis]
MSFATQMLDMLTSAYARTDIRKIEKLEPPETYIGKLFSIVGWGFDVFHDQAEKVRLWDSVDKMRGATLDSFGGNYGVTRGQASDEMYRVMIKVKILAMLAAGNLDTLILSAASLFGVDAEDVRCEEIYPAKVYLYIDEDRLDEDHKNVADIIAGLMSRIKSGGVGIRIFYRTYSQHRTKLYAGISSSMATFLDVPPAPINKKSVKQVELGTGVGTLVCVTIAYPASR